jgi:hypothetical protein
LFTLISTPVVCGVSIFLIFFVHVTVMVATRWRDAVVVRVVVVVGAKVTSGPITDPNSTRGRKARASGADGWLQLPAGGWGGGTPGWPLPELPSKFVSDLFDDLWSLPQSYGWVEVIGLMPSVLATALYCQNVEFYSEGNPKFGTEIRAFEDRFGMSPASIARLKWRAPGGESKSVVLAPVRDMGGRKSASSRLKERLNA